jgi:pyrroline-5-carboxylate reductase
MLGPRRWRDGPENSVAEVSVAQHIAFIGGGNMASAIISGLRGKGMAASQILVVEPLEAQRQRLEQAFGIQCLAQASTALQVADLVVWAVKPQSMREATALAAAHTAAALHLSVAAGIPSASLAQWLGTDRVVRAMPNTPALIGKGITGLFARAGASAADRSAVEEVVAATGDFLWMERESQLDAVTALSGSGPAYVYYFLEAMREAGSQMGLPPAQAYQLAVATFIGAGELAKASSEAPEVLRERVTSKGGTTHAAITALQDAQVKALFQQALHAAERRAAELGREFGA